MKARQKRKLFRWIHIIGRILLIVYVYSPLKENVLFENLIQYGVIPLVGISALALLKGFLWLTLLLNF